MNFINEDSIVNWVKENNGILHTRKVSNINQINLERCPENTLVCLTGYNNILYSFFNNIINSFRNKIILITIETDEFNMKNEYINHPLVKHWFTWNKSIIHNKLTCLPIGLNYDRQQIILEKYINFKSIKNTDQRQLLCINCSLETNNKRGELIQLATNQWKSFCNIIPNIPFLKQYINNSHVDGKIKISVTHPKCYDLISNYKFILSPRGAGEDCHRTWEALYLDIIPIVLSSSINEIYEDLPVLVINNWNEINEDFLKQKYNEIFYKKKNNLYNMEKITLNYWLNKIKDKM